MFTCTGCGIYKPLAEFHTLKRGKRGHSTRCSACLKLYNDAYLESRKRASVGKDAQCSVCDAHLKLGVNWRRCDFKTDRLMCSSCATIKRKRKSVKVALTTTMFHLARQRARARDIAFDIAKADIVIPERCPVLGIELSGGIGKLHDGSPTLDRIDPKQGYVKGNIAVISHRANRLKSNASLEELEALTVWLREVSASK